MGRRRHTAPTDARTRHRPPIVALILTLVAGLLHLAPVHAQAAASPTAAAHRAQARHWESASRYPAAIAELRLAYALDRGGGRGGARRGVTTDLIALGRAYLTVSRYAPALDAFRRALPAAEAAGDGQDVAVALTDIGVSHDGLGQTRQARPWYARALTAWRRLHSKRGEVLALTDLGLDDEALAAPARAMAEDRAALPLAAAIRNVRGEVVLLNDIALVFQDTGRYAEALATYRRALPLVGQVPDRRWQEDWGASLLSGIGYEYGELSRYDEALQDERRALPVLLRLGDDNEAGSTLAGIGAVYDLLGRFPEAMAVDLQALRLTRRAGNRSGEALLLTNLGAVCDDEGQYAAALHFYREALPIRVGLGDLNGEAGTLNNIGVALDDLHRYPEALALYRQSLPLWRRAGGLADEAVTFNDAGAAFFDEGDDVGARADYERALALRRRLGLRDVNVSLSTLGNLMQVWGASDNPRRTPRLAIFYGKEAVNSCQTIRRDVQALGPKSQRAFLATFGYLYRNLADLLIGQGRLPEAQQVLRLLKQQEFYDFLNPGRGQPAAPAALDVLPLTAREGAWHGRLAVAADGRLRDTLARMAADFAGPATAADVLPDTAQEADLARALPPGTVAVDTIVEPDKLDLIVVTPAHDGQPSAQVYRSVPVTAAALYQSVYNLRNALADPSVNPQSLAAGLYKLLFGPIQKDLDDAHADTVLFSLDDALRYLPLAALYDDTTHQYVVQRYATALITLAAQTPPAPAAAPAPRVLGAGVSLPLDGLPALPGVAVELGDIVRGPDNPGGLLPGLSLLDPAFTRAALLDGLDRGGYPFVHLASHFALRPTDVDSYLLLGDGSRLSVADIARGGHIFRGVSLLALSACDTDMEIRSSTGREVEGLGALAQRLGARSVLASLWPVSDDATPVLMDDFYGLLRAHPGWPLPRVLQAAQLRMLTGRDVSLPHPDGPHRGFEMVNGPQGPALPPFAPPTGVPFAHPDYWAPFVLIGNWR